MTEAMAHHADGIIIHPFNTGSFVAERTLPMIEAGLEAAGKSRADFVLNVGCIANPCLTDEEYARATTAMRFNLAFYASTPAYRVTLDHHGLGELQPRLREITKSGDWSTLGDLIDDDVLDLLAVRGTPEQCAARLVDEYGGLADRLSLTASTASADALTAMIAAMAALG
jgi:alkanesulfonate monooxygenase SsuD/methylene tetrahydromethanopterin reductase-like flavin-dependent oxidoreductase (luciferase family)